MRFPDNIILSTKNMNYTPQNYWVSLYSNRIQLAPRFQSTAIFTRVIDKFVANYSITYLLPAICTTKSNTYYLNKDVTWDFYSIFFLRKERMYTKLKYSRVAQFDIASGAIAALLAAFLGFLISEKFGFELVDSGDFYFLFMYIIFLCYALRLLLKVSEAHKITHNCYSLAWVIQFYLSIWNLLLSLIMKLGLRFKSLF